MVAAVEGNGCYDNNNDIIIEWIMNNNNSDYYHLLSTSHILGTKHFTGTVPVHSPQQPDEATTIFPTSLIRKQRD